jgi:ABC-type thiamine transport system substrate-binding protein
VPDARLDGTADTRRGRDRGIDVTLGLDAASASRYAVSGVLYGRDASGRMVSGAYAQSAAWVAPGRGSLTLHFDRSSVAGINAPYELRDLRLQDQPAISLLEHRALALRFDRP